jgi:hypothetical protein
MGTRKVKKKVISRLPPHYSSIDDCPVFIWEKLHSSGDLTWMLIKKKTVPKKQMAELQKIFDSMYDEYFSEFGFNDEFLDIKRKEFELAKLKLQLIITDDRTLITDIEIAEEELKDMRGPIKKPDFMLSKIAIEKKLGHQLNMRETTVKEFYSYIKHLK